VFAIDDFDHKVSKWAADKNPVFGSENTARDVSDYARDVLMGETLVTAALTPSGDEFKEWTIAKLRGLGVEGAALLATSGATDELKDLVGRTRPDGSNDSSMPSGHASSAFAAARLSNRNLDSMDMNGAWRTGLKAANLGLAGTVAWARVEGRKHYPSEVLVGAALGNLLSVFIHDAFMNLPEEGEEEKVSIYVEPTPRGFWAAVSVKF
jgi:membrane-associated phospholipid phosphatase